MFARLLVITMVTLFINACSLLQFSSPPEPIVISQHSSPSQFDFLHDVKPILDKRCVSCHSCYNAPCQTKLSSYEGIDRGGTKQRVYNVTRLRAVSPTRLFQDALNTDEWRGKGFYTVTQNEDNNGNQNNDIMSHLLNHKMEHPEIIGEYDPEYETLLCPKNNKELGEYFQKKPNHGMPYGFPALQQSEYDTLIQWLSYGAKGPSEEQQKKLVSPSARASLKIKLWEKFLNQANAKHTVSARYLFEHFYLAHLSFIEQPDEFYRLVRSRTVAPVPIDEIVTSRPFEDPKVERVYYRFLKIHSTIVHKTHMVVSLDDTILARITQQFIETPWAEAPHYIDYDIKESANPFLVFSQIPTRSRYQFLLDNSHYIIMTFIRGPVCRGQMALNVIHDHFWVMFQDPDHDLSVLQPHFLLRQAKNLTMPIESNNQSIFKTFTNDYRKLYSAYAHAKYDRIHQLYPEGMDYDGIWRGEKATDSPMLTIYRHFNNASVHKGALGSLPRTMWVIDFAQLERIYYNLVAGYDVFGNVAHQANVRRYMDFLRIEGEVNFLNYMPLSERAPMFRSWYIGHKYEQLNENEMPNVGSSGIDYKTTHYKAEFVQNLVEKHFLAKTNISFDKFNYLKPDEKKPEMPRSIETEQDLEQALKALTLPNTSFLTYMNDSAVNTIHLRLTEDDGSDYVVTIVINRWHDNVFSQFNEASTLNAEKDTLHFIKGSIGSYVNVFVELKASDINDFLYLLAHFKGSKEDVEKAKKYFVSRSDPQFWQSFDWFQAHFNKAEPFISGLYDLNRYHRTPW